MKVLHCTNKTINIIYYALVLLIPFILMVIGAVSDGKLTESIVLNTCIIIVVSLGVAISYIIIGWFIIIFGFLIKYGSWIIGFYILEKFSFIDFSNTVFFDYDLTFLNNTYLQLGFVFYSIYSLATINDDVLLMILREE